MKNIISNVNLNILGDELIRKINSNNNPFNVPYIVFFDSLYEKWFKNYYLKNNDTVLMGINYFSFNDAKQLFIDRNQKDLVNTELKAIIMDEIARNYNDYESINTYIRKDDKISPSKLLSISSTIASLISDYEKEEYDINKWDENVRKIYLNITNKYLTVGKSISSLSYKKINRPIYFFAAFNSSKLEQTFIDKLSANNDVTVFEINKSEVINKDFSYSAAPSKIREIEYIHSQICELLKNKGATYNDFLVVAPSVNDYLLEISRVFKQDNKKFLDIPYTIKSKQKVESNVSAILSKIDRIAKKGYLTRNDFYELIQNSLLKELRQYNDDDIETMMQTIVNLNVYRKTPHFDAWNYLKKRLLISKLTAGVNLDNDTVNLKNKEYIAYSDIALDDDLIVKFVDLINDIESVSEFISKQEYINENNLNELVIQLDKLVSKKQDEIETNKVYKKLLEYIEFYKNNEINKDNIPFDVLISEFG